MSRQRAVNLIIDFPRQVQRSLEGSGEGGHQSWCSWSQSEGHGELESGREECPPGLSRIELFSCPEIFKVLNQTAGTSGQPLYIVDN